ncbi:ROK family transcriptional regulator [Frigoribacterium sp. PhB118]|uniref:ROK family transcriptional regulator n=1 Tax=Frigoribacterium sp. PhB118 TaxID=2485175 RepID=UPI000F4A82C4|nr:ROK family transcriptional regulator [Frigoribacterium sp. PhB118]ROS53761.1 putative NBD/HSP70 family sugar kinase [Frigoribacterium sp. PhB118]
MTDSHAPGHAAPAHGSLGHAHGGWSPLAGSAQAVVLDILVHGARPRTELAARLGLSGPSLTRITRPLLESGLLVERASLAPSGSGRPSVPLDLDPDAHHFVGVKLTRDRLFVVVTDQRGRVLDGHDDDLPDPSPAAVVAQVAAVVTSARGRDDRIRAVGVTVGGQVVDRAHVRHAPFLGWDDVPLAELLTAMTDLPTWVENDVRALTQAELWFGEGRGLRSFALVTIGAGVGLGLVAAGEVLGGAHSSAGSVGHQRIVAPEGVPAPVAVPVPVPVPVQVPLPVPVPVPVPVPARVPASAAAAARADVPAPTCDLGHHDCASAFLTVAAVEAAAARALGRPVAYDDLLVLAADGHQEARVVVDTAADVLGQLIAGVLNVLDPEVVLMSGEGVRLATVGGAAVDAAIARDAHRAVPPPRLLVQEFRFDEWARGAAAVAIQMHALGR